MASNRDQQPGMPCVAPVPPQRPCRPLTVWVLRFVVFSAATFVFFHTAYYRFGDWSIGALGGLLVIGLSFAYPRTALAAALAFLLLMLTHREFDVPTMEKLVPQYAPGMQQDQLESHLPGNPQKEIWHDLQGLMHQQDMFGKPSPFRYPVWDRIVLYRMNSHHCHLFVFYVRDAETGRFTARDYHIAGRG